MAYGGKVAFVVTDGRWQISGRANKLKIDTSLWEMLANPKATPDLTPAVVQFPLVAEEILARGYRLRTTLNEAEILLEF